MKRSPWYGLPNSAKANYLGGILTNALNVARFVREATLAAVGSVTYMSDGALAPEGYTPVQMELVQRGQSGVYEITLTADPAWLADPARVYPVTIDPWIVIRPAAKDTILFSGAYANTNYGSSTQLAMGYSTSGAWKARSLL